MILVEGFNRNPMGVLARDCSVGRGVVLRGFPDLHLGAIVTVRD